MSEQCKASGNSRGFTVVSAALWALSVACVVLVLRNLHERAAAIYEDLEITLPTILRLGLDAGEFLSTPLGLGVAGGVLVLSTIPLVLGKGSHRLGVSYLALGGLVLTFGMLTFSANQEALSSLEQFASPR